MTQEYYTGIHGVVTFAGSALAVAEFGFAITRATTSHARTGKWSDLNAPGKVSCQGVLRRIQKNYDLIAAMMNATPTTGAAETLKTGVTVAADGYTAMTDTEIASASRVRATVVTDAITTAGYITFIGEDAAGTEIEETVAVGTIGVGEYVTSTKVFKKVFGVVTRTIASTGGGTFTIASIAGTATVVLGAPKTFTLIGQVADGSNNITVTLTNAWLGKAGLNFTDASKMLDDDCTFEVKDPDADIAVTGVDA